MGDIALASMTFLGEMADHKMVIDITIIGHGRQPLAGLNNYAVHLSLADRTTISSDGSSLQEAIDEAYKEFRAKQNKHRN